MRMWRRLFLMSASLAALTCVAWADPAPLVVGDTPIELARYQAGAFSVDLRADTQTIAGLSPGSAPDFSFTPKSREAERQGDGYVHLGDLHLRVRQPDGSWSDFSSAHSRVPVRALPVKGTTLAAADITATMGKNAPLSVQRYWLNENGALVLRFVLSNPSAETVEIGALGMPMVFDNILTGRSLEEAHAQASFVDPYIGRDAGYLQVTRLNGKGPVLLVLPDGQSPLEAYRPILGKEAAARGDIFTDRTPRGQTFEGFYDWTIASRGFLEKEWKDADEQWNEASTIKLAPGATRSVGVRFVLSPAIRDIEKTLIAHNRPVAVGIPGYVLPTDVAGSLFLRASRTVKRIDIAPAGALNVSRASPVRGWARYDVRGVNWGRARLSITYTDNTVQTVSYFVTQPAQQVVTDLGHFTTTRQWYDDAADPFHRAPAILTFDRATNQIVTQESRAWIAGMSDEGGAGSWVAAMMKQLDNPVASEVKKLERLVNETVVGKLQVADGEHAGGVKKSLFYYEPQQYPGYYDPSLNWKTWTSWPRKEADDLGRSYNYPHVAIGHWVLYRLARHYTGLVNAHEWAWYLDHAYLTGTAMMRDAPYYAQFGQMEGEVFLEILKDLEREGWTEKAHVLRNLMQQRTDHWKSLSYPFGSEMPWDSTGQPEVYAWLRYFGNDDKATGTREVILAYDPTVPNWGYNGNARRYWDFLYGGKLSRIERQIHHYGSALNAVPLFDAYRTDPQDLYVLRVAYGGLLGSLTNIDQDGFGSAAFHSYPDQMRFDSLTGDYGMGFFGHAYATACYVVNDPTFGWLGFGGNLSRATRGVMHIEPTDSGRSRLFIAPEGLWVTLAAGKIESADYDLQNGALTVHLTPADEHTPAALIAVESTSPGAKHYALANLAIERGYYRVPMGKEKRSVTLTRS